MLKSTDDFLINRPLTNRPHTVRSQSK